MTWKKTFRKILKIIAWITGSIIVLLLLVFILIQIPAVQNFAKNKIVAYLENKLHTKVAIGKLDIDFPKKIVLENIYFEDQKKDTLLYGAKISIDIDMFKLLSNTVELTYLELNDIKANIYRLQPDTVFNFDYIIKAFVSPKTATAAAGVSSVKFNIGKIVLNNIQAVYKDDETGNDVFFQLGKFETHIKTFDPAHAVYAIPDITVANIRSVIRQYKPLITPKPMAVVEAKSNEPITTKLELNKIDLSGIYLDYKNEVSALKTTLQLGKFETVVDKIDLSKLFISLSRITLNNTDAAIELGKSLQAVIAKKEVQKKVVAEANNPWKIQIASIAFDNNNLRYDDHNKPEATKGLDYNHLFIQNFTLNVNDLVLTPTQYAGSLNKLAFKEQSGLQLKQLQTAFLYNEHETHLNNFLLQTNHSKINAALQAKYTSVDAISKDPGKLWLDAVLDNSSVAVKDILLINPALQSWLKGNENSIIKIDGKAIGFVNDMTIPGFSLSGYGQTLIQLSGKIKGLPVAEKAYYDVNILKLSTEKKDIIALIPKDAVPANIRIPEKINAKGFLKGTMQAFSSQINTQTTNGTADIIAAISNGGKSYDIKAVLNKVDLGYIISQDSIIGNISLEATAKGSGMDYKTMNTVVHAEILQAEVKGYEYKDILFDATTDNGNAAITSSMNDENIRYSLNAHIANLANKFPAVQMKCQLDTLNLYALHFTNTPLTVNTTLTADMSSTNPDSPEGSILLTDIKLVKDAAGFSTDTVSMVAARDNGMQSIIINSEAVSATWEGDYKLTETWAALQHTINRYYNIPSFKDTAFTAQQWQVDIRVKPSSQLALQLMPEFKGSGTVGTKITYSSSSNDLKLELNAPLIKYGKQKIEQFNVTATTMDNQLDYSISANKLGTKSFQLYESSLKGNIAGNKLLASLLLKDRNRKDRYHLTATVNQSNNAFRLALNPDSLLLNYKKWQMSTDNFIQYDSSGIIVNDFAISNKEESLRINSASPSSAAPIEVAFKNFKIKTLTEFAEQNSLLMDGTINGAVTVIDVMKNPVFTSDLTVNDLSHKTDTIGNVLIKVDNQTANVFTSDVRIQGKGNDARLNGKYYTGEGRMDMQLNINNIDLSSIKGFTAGQIRDAGGSLKANISIAGTTTKPSVNGNLHFANAFITPTMLGGPFKLSDEKIEVSNNGIRFNNFTLIDSAGNKAILNGDIATTDFKDYKFSLDFNADDFTLVNSTQADNRLFYGKLNMDANVKIGGDLETPSVKAVVRANKSTDFTFVLPGDDPEIESRGGLVNFVDMDAPKDTLTITEDIMPQFKALAGLDIDATVETDTAAAFTLVIDERNGDALRVKGKAELAGGIDKSGRLTLAGSYALQSGSYQVSLSVLKRKFNIQKGSTIAWKGDPLSATADVTALYEIKTSTIDLLESQMAGRSEADVNKFKQKIPIQVFLKMNGDLMKPAITFDIALPDDIASQWKEVDDKLTQLRVNESEMNKQVFALLLLGRFTQEDPLVSSGGSSNDALVRQSVSRILTDQLNKLAGSLVKGVDLSLGVNSGEDYSKDGTAKATTDLTVAVSKSLLNDRLRVSVGSNYQVEGPAASNPNSSNFGGDVALDYQLTQDGRYRIRGYRINKYEAAIEGQVIETGLTFILTLDYDQFREIFKRNNMSKKKKN